MTVLSAHLAAVALVVGLIALVAAAGGRRAVDRHTRGSSSRLPAAPSGSGPVVVVSGSYGAGHDAAAARIVEQLRGTGREVVLVDVVDCYPFGAGRLLRRAYFLQLSTCPSSWGRILDLLASDTRAARLVSRVVVGLLAWLPARRLLAAVPAGSPLIVSTHPFASAALGRLRSCGTLGAETATYLTDPSVHELWVHAGVDVHLAIYPEAARQARALGAANVRLIRPLVTTSGAEATAARRLSTLDRLGVVPDRPVVLVVGGSEGVGELSASAVEVAGTGLATAVVVCGHNDALRAELGHVPGVMALPWQDGLTDLVAAADCVVQNAGGFTALEAMAVGTPVISYRCLPGHGWSNAAALEHDGLASWPRDVRSLVDALTDALTGSLAEAFTAHGAPPVDWAPRPTLSDALGLRPIRAVAETV